MVQIMKVRFIQKNVIPYANTIGQIMDVNKPVADLLIARGKVEVVDEKDDQSKSKKAKK